ENGGSERTEKAKLIPKFLGPFTKRMQPFRACCFDRFPKRFAPSPVGFLHVSTQAFAAQIVQLPLLDPIESLAQLFLRLAGPFRKCRQKAVELEGEQFFRFLKT